MLMRGRPKTVLWTVLGALAGVVGFVSMLNGQTPLLGALYRVVVGWSFIGVGIVLLSRHVPRRLSNLLIAVGFAWFLGEYFGTHVPVIVGLSFAVADLFRVFLAQAALSYPSGRLRTGFARVVIGLGYLFILVGGLVHTIGYNPYEYYTCDCPNNALGFIHNEHFYSAVDNVYAIVGAVLEVLVIALLIKVLMARERGVDRLPILASTIALATLLVANGMSQTQDLSDSTVQWMYFVVSVALVGSAFSYLRTPPEQDPGGHEVAATQALPS